MSLIRPPAVAGMFYPAEKQVLEKQIHNYLKQTGPEQVPASIAAIIVPHAGYSYSGRTAAYAYSMLNGKSYDTVVIVSPSHREYFPGISVYKGDGYSTPLGVMPVNKEMGNRLVGSSSHIFWGMEGHRQEHALEVQLPFLQVILKEFSIVPIVIGDQHKAFVYELGDRLSEIMDDRTLIVASSDLSHFHTKHQAFALDSIVEKRVQELDYDGLLTDLELHKCEACGGGPIAAVMRAVKLKGRNGCMVLDRSDSGDVSGDNSEVVGYLSAVLY